MFKMHRWITCAHTKKLQNSPTPYLLEIVFVQGAIGWTIKRSPMALSVCIFFFGVSQFLSYALHWLFLGEGVRNNQRNKRSSSCLTVCFFLFLFWPPHLTGWQQNFSTMTKACFNGFYWSTSWDHVCFGSHTPLWSIWVCDSARKSSFMNL